MGDAHIAVSKNRNPGAADRRAGLEMTLTKRAARFAVGGAICAPEEAHSVGRTCRKGGRDAGLPASAFREKVGLRFHPRLKTRGRMRVKVPCGHAVIIESGGVYLDFCML